MEAEFLKNQLDTHIREFWGKYGLIVFSVILYSTLILSPKETVSDAYPGFEFTSNKSSQYQFTSEAQLMNDHHALEIEEFYKKGNEDFFEGKEQVQIYYKIFRQPVVSSAILISSGRTEAAIKYKELIYDLYKNGYSVYIMDHRGQGLSGRMTSDPEMGYVEGFQYYVDDLKKFYDKMVSSSNHNEKYLLCHSMGGAIGMTYLEQHQNDFNAAAFSSPMLGLHGGVCNGAKILEPKEPTYGLGEGAYSTDQLAFKKNPYTGSKVRYKRMINAFELEPKARLGGATYQWVVESCQQFNYINANIDRLETPFVLFSAEDEKIVSLKAHKRFIKKVEKLGKVFNFHMINNAKHELLIERDKARIETLNLILTFFDRYQ